MVDIMLETLGFGMANAKDLYVAVRIGDAQKLSRVSADARKFTFPEKSFASRSYGKLEIFRHVGSCTFGTDGKLTNSVQELSMNPGAGLDDLRFRISLGSPQGGGIPPPEPEKQDKGRSEAQAYLEKHQLQLRLADMMHSLLREKPDDPMSFVSAKLHENERIVRQGGTGGEPQSATAPPRAGPVPSPKPAAEAGPTDATASANEQLQSAEAAKPVPVVLGPVQPVQALTAEQPVQQIEQPEQTDQTEQTEQTEQIVQPVARSEARKRTAAWERKGAQIFEGQAAAPLESTAPDIMAEMRAALGTSTASGLLQQTLEEMSLSDANRQASSALTAAGADGRLVQLLACADVTGPRSPLPGAAEAWTLLKSAADDGRLQDFLQSVPSPPPGRGALASAAGPGRGRSGAKHEARLALERAAEDGNLAQYLTALKERDPQVLSLTALSRDELREVCAQARNALASSAACGQLSSAFLSQITGDAPDK